MFVEYAKNTAEDIVIHITALNRGPGPARLHILPTFWFRNRWDWGDPYDMPKAARVNGPAGASLIEAHDYHYGQRWLLCEGSPELLFTNNETNNERLYNSPNRTPYVKDAFHRYVVNAEQSRRESQSARHQGCRALQRRNCAGAEPYFALPPH